MRIVPYASIAGLLGLTLCQPSYADEVVLYRCSDAGGAVAFQDAPCGPGRRQEVLRMERPEPPSPPAEPQPQAPTPPADIGPAPAAAPPETTPPAAAPWPPPPPLWRCRGLDKAPYISEVPNPQPKCLPLATMGYDVSRLPPQMQGACQYVYDQCTVLNGRELCDAWEQKLEQAEGELSRAFSDTEAQRRAEVERLQSAIAGTRCQ